MLSSDLAVVIINQKKLIPGKINTRVKMNFKISEQDWNSPNSMLSWYLITSYAYYVIGESIITDLEFDDIVKRVKENWDLIEHPHKHLIKLSHLEANTGYDIKFPKIVKHNAYLILRGKNED